MLFCINNLKKQYNTAENKAVEDVALICQERLNAKVIPFYEIKEKENSSVRQLVQRFRNYYISICNWTRLFFKVNKDDIVLVQHPYEKSQISILFTDLCKLKGIRFIGLIHDLVSLRGAIAEKTDEKTKKRGNRLDNILLRKFDLVICHNPVMKAYLENQGFPESKLISLGIFDYIHHSAIADQRKLSKRIVLAGNLIPAKCSYLYKLQDLEEDPGFNIELFGPGYKEFSCSFITYHGVFLPEELPGKLDGSFGLIWDGTELNGCAGNTGDYIRYNNPHKVSLYLASNLPVIIWKEAALASFIQENHLGFAVDSILDISETISKFSDEEYQEIFTNVKKMGEKIRSGAFLTEALESAISQIE